MVKWMADIAWLKIFMVMMGMLRSLLVEKYVYEPWLDEVSIC